MAHLVETMAYNKAEAPWHGLGVPVDNNMTTAEMQKASGTDWEVAKRSTFFEATVDGKTKRFQTGQKALVRVTDHKVLSPNVGPDWEPIQNSEAFDFFKEYVEAGQMTMETAGSLREGQVVWVLAKVGKSFTILGKDTVESYLLFSNSHQYGRSAVADFTPIRVVCNNTLTLALNQKSKESVSISHRSKFDPAKVKELLGIASQKLDTYHEAAEFLSSKQASQLDIVEYFKAIFPVHGADPKKEISKNAKIALEVLPAQPGAELGEGTWWQAFNAVTYMADHVLCREDDTRLYNAWFGGTKDTKVKALSKALEMAKAS